MMNFIIKVCSSKFLKNFVLKVSEELAKRTDNKLDDKLVDILAKSLK